MGTVPEVEDLAAVLGCKVATLPMSYLGLPLGSSFKEKTIGLGDAGWLLKGGNRNQ